MSFSLIASMDNRNLFIHLPLIFFIHLLLHYEYITWAIVRSLSEAVIILPLKALSDCSSFFLSNCSGKLVEDTFQCMHRGALNLFWNDWLNQIICMQYCFERVATPLPINPRLPKGDGYHPLKDFKTLNSIIKRLQLIAGSSIPVILAQKFLLPYLPWGRDRVRCQS